MPSEKTLKFLLFVLRLSVFLVMFMWTLDKFIRPAHASAVWQRFYFSPAFGWPVSWLIGLVQLAVVLAFLVGFEKKISYGAILVLHGISTVSCLGQYLSPYTGINLLFFAAWPMLAVCYVLYVLREYDTLLTLNGGSK